MIATDILMLLAAVVFLIAWWMRRMPARPIVLLASAAALLAASLAGLAMDRWQAGVGVIVALVLLAVLLVNRLRKAPAKEGLPFVSGIVFSLAAAGAIGAIAMFPVYALPRPDGEYPVGVRTFEIADASRLGVYEAKPDEPRRLLVRVWYPAGDTRGLRRQPYFTQRESETTARSLGALAGFPPFFAYVKHVRTNSWTDAPLLPGAANLPVALYSHGYTSFLGQNTVLMEHLASHGYIVFSVQHTYDSSATLFPNGDVAPMDSSMFDVAAATELPKSQTDAMGGATPLIRLNGFIDYRMEGVAAGERTVSKSARIWVDDRLFLHDQLQAGAVPAEIAPIAAAGNLSRVGEMGMSFGGATSGTVCMIDPRCAAGINLDGGDFHFVAFNAAVPTPFLMFHSDLANIYRAVGVEPQNPPRSFNEFSYEPIASAGSREDVYRVSLKGAQHLGISDFSLFVRRPIRDPLFGTTPSDVLIEAQNDFVLGFFDKHLRKTDTSFPAPQLETYRNWVSKVDNSDLRAWWASLPESDRTSFEARINAARDAAPAAPQR